MTATVDHLVYACPELGPAVERVAALTGVRPAYGGQHPGLGTHNALLSLGPRTYLEIIAPDPAQPRPAEPLPFGLARLSEPALLSWAAAPGDLDAAVQRSAAAGFGYGPVIAGQRRTAEGHDLAWRMTESSSPGEDGVVPFLIDWGASPHPAAGAPAGVRLTEFRISSPDPGRLTARLQLLGLDLPVDAADRPALRAVLTGPGGEAVTLAG
jgi:hypothetical protein